MAKKKSTMTNKKLTFAGDITIGSMKDNASTVGPSIIGGSEFNDRVD